MSELAGTEVKINCAACGNALDVTGREPFSTLPCPHCAAQLTVPKPFAHFLLLSIIGTGGIGAVYRAMDLTLHRYVAIKLLKKELAEDAAFISDFSREARAAAALNHANIAQVYSFGASEGQYYLVMELIEYGSLDALIDERKRLTEIETLEYGIQIASALGAAYQRGVIHRDVKPGNILITNDGTAKLVDFGLAKFKDIEHAGEKGEGILATPYYIAPEKMRGQTEDFRSDMYSLGGTLFQCLSGHPPFDAPTASEVIQKNLNDEPPTAKSVAPGISEATNLVIGRLLKKTPEERYADYEKLIDDLKAAKEYALKEEALRSPKRKKAKVAAGMGALVVLVVIGAALLTVDWNKMLTPPPLPPPPPLVRARVLNPGAPSIAQLANFSRGTQMLNRANFIEAGPAYASAIADLEAFPTERDWATLMRGVTWLLLADSDKATVALEPFTANVKNPTVTDPLNYESLPKVLAWMAVDKIPDSAVEEHEAKLPPWGRAAYLLTRGAKDYSARRYESAAKSFQAYKTIAPDKEHAWLYEFRTLAEKLGSEMEAAALTFGRIKELKNNGQYEKAMNEFEKGRARLANATMPVRRHLLSMEPDLRRLIEDDRKIEEDKKKRSEQQRLVVSEAQQKKDLTALADADKTAETAKKDYNFFAIAKAYDALKDKLTLTEAKEKFVLSQFVATQLLAFKRQLIADVKTLPYDKGDLVTRSGSSLVGALAKADDENIIFVVIVDGGQAETEAGWKDLAPSQLAKLAEFYAALVGQKKPPPPELATRYLTLAVFYKYYDFPKDAERAAKEAVRLQPSLKPQAEKYFGSIFG